MASGFAKTGLNVGGFAVLSPALSNTRVASVQPVLPNQQGSEFAERPGLDQRKRKHA